MMCFLYLRIGVRSQYGEYENSDYGHGVGATKYGTEDRLALTSRYRFGTAPVAFGVHNSRKHCSRYGVSLG